MDLRVYWKEVRELERELPEYVWLMSLDDPKRGMVGGRMAEVGAAQAAPLLHAKSHRRATDAEIDAYLAKENQARRRSFHEGMRRKGIAVVPVAEPKATSEAGDKREPARRR